MSDKEPFERGPSVDKPGIIGAQWWHEGLKNRDAAVSRRKALVAMAAATGMIAMTCFMCNAVKNCGDDDEKTAVQSRGALDMQREYGWNFGATDQSLTFDGLSTRAFEREALSRMGDDLRPPSMALSPYYALTLFQSPTAIPKSTPQGDPGKVAPLKDALQPIFTPAMDTAYRQGRALASLFEGVASGAIAVVVDLPGPESVAFAAGMAERFDPVFTFDNWPHPRGVVPAHMTLAACAYYQPLFVRRSQERAAGAPPVFVLDRARLKPYSDDAGQFDNRYVAKLPSPAGLVSLGVRRVLYVTPTDADVLELDDLNDDFVDFAHQRIEVRILAANAFGPDAADATAHVTEDAPPYYYGREAATHFWFWKDYPWAPERHKPVKAPSIPTPGKAYVPKARTTQFSSGSPGHSGSKPRPHAFGMVPVVVAVATGAILGARFSRSGSWNRSSGGWGG